MVKPVKTRPRFRCDHCRKTGVAESIARHEQICWKNPDRLCPTCNNTGEVSEYIEGAGTKIDPCPFCSQRNEDIA